MDQPFPMRHTFLISSALDAMLVLLLPLDLDMVHGAQATSEAPKVVFD